MNPLSDIIPDDLARQGKFQIMTRVGFVARGMLYILIAMLVLGTGRTEDLTGALDYLGGGVGRWLLLAVAAGMVTYALWRLSDAAFGIEAGGHNWKAWRKRAAAAGVGLVYLYLAYKAARILIAGKSGSMTVEQQADKVLDLPGGMLVLAAASLALAIGAAAQLRKAVSCSFLEPLDADALSPAVKWLGRLGYAARAVIILLIAFLIGRAALDGSSDEAGGMEQALDLLSGPLLYAVALGLLLLGLFSLVEARYRRVHRPPMAKIKHDVREAVSPEN